MTHKPVPKDLAAAHRALQADFSRLQKQSRSCSQALLDRETILDLLPALLAFVDSKFRFIWVNKPYADWYGLSRADIIGKRVRDIIAPASYRGARPHMSAALKGERIVFENIAYGPDGKMRAVRASYLPVPGIEGKTAGFIGLVEDITAQRQAEQERDLSAKNLKVATEEIKALRGFIPICCNCKKIRNDEGYWEILEKYVREHMDATLTHGLCPDCAEKLYPSLNCVKRKKPGQT